MGTRISDMFDLVGYIWLVPRKETAFSLQNLQLLEGFLLFPEVKVRVNFRCQWKNSKTNVSFCVYVLNSIKHSS